MDNKGKTKKEPTFPQELFAYKKRYNTRYGGTYTALEPAKDIESHATAKGTDVAVYRLVKVVRAVKKVTVAISVSEQTNSK